MINIDSIIENIYLNVNLMNESKFIISPKFSNESMYKVNSRYKVLGVNYSPYKITKEFYHRLYNSLILIPNINNITDNNYLLFESNSTYAIMFAPVQLKNLLFEDDLTPNGLLAFRASRYFGNEKFKDKVESELLKFCKEYEFNGVNYFIEEDIDFTKLEETDDRIKSVFLNQNCFHWSEI